MNKYSIVVCIVLLLLGTGVFWWYQTKESILIIPTVQEEKVQVPTLPSLSLETIFSSDHSWTEQLSEDKKIILIATGDVIPARSVNYKTIQAKDFTWAWNHIAPLLFSGDLTLINLESPLIEGCKTTVEGMVFCGDPNHIDGLLFAGVDIVNLANNHTGNYGTKGIEETKALIEKKSMVVSGLGEVGTKEVKGVTFAFLGFDDIGPHVAPIAKMEEETVKTQIFEAKKRADIVIVSFHWGVEYVDKPNDRQKLFAHLAVDNGADLVIGNHPHWIQPLEIYNGKVIMYAHGNTIFDQMWSEETKKGVIGKYIFYDKKLVDVEFFPTYIKNYGQPAFIENEQKNIMLQKIFQMSRLNL